MNRKSSQILILLLLALAAFAGCSDDDDPVGPDPTPEQTPFEALVEQCVPYINDADDCPGVISAQALYNDQISAEPVYTVIDIRSQADFDNLGHIEGAIHSTLATLLTDVAAIPQDEHLVVTCYTGQSAGWAKLALELMGWEDVKTLGFGMSSWNTTLCGSWNSNVGNLLGTPETELNNDELVENAFPVLSGVTTDNVLATKVAALLATPFSSRGLNYATYLALPVDEQDDYFFLNYWGATDYTTLGHIPGAYQFTPAASLDIDQMLANIPTDKKIVVYCWTGQTSAQIAGYLYMLGYDAYTLSFGANKLFHDSLEAGKRWDQAEDSHDFPLVMTE